MHVRSSRQNDSACPHTRVSTVQMRQRGSRCRCGLEAAVSHHVQLLVDIGHPVNYTQESDHWSTRQWLAAHAYAHGSTLCCTQSKHAAASAYRTATSVRGRCATSAHLSMRPSRMSGAYNVEKSLPVTKMGMRMFIALARHTSPMLTCVGSSHMFINVEHTIWLFTVHCVACKHGFARDHAFRMHPHAHLPQNRPRVDASCSTPLQPPQRVSEFKRASDLQQTAEQQSSSSCARRSGRGRRRCRSASVRSARRWTC